MKSLDFVCRRPGIGECREKRSNKLPCKFFDKPELYPALPKEQRKALQKIRDQEGRGLYSDDEDSDEEDDIVLTDLRARRVDEDESALSAVIPRAQLSDEVKAQVRNDVAKLQLKDGAFANVAMSRVDAMDPFVGLECQPEPEAA